VQAEREKCRLLLAQKDKEIAYLTEINGLLKNQQNDTA